jgi:hypothetical protein
MFPSFVDPMFTDTPTQAMLPFHCLPICRGMVENDEMENSRCGLPGAGPMSAVLSNARGLPGVNTAGDPIGTPVPTKP